MNIEIIALIAISVAFASGFGFGWLLGEVIFEFISRLEEYHTLTDRDEKGRFKKSMRVLKDG